MRLPRFARRSLLATTLILSSATVAMAAGGNTDAANGKKIFDQRCGICHAVSKAPGGPIVGPNMVGLVGPHSRSMA
jgi:cytochrome c2